MKSAMVQQKQLLSKPQQLSLSFKCAERRIDRPMTSIEEKLLHGITAMGKTLEKHGTLMEEIKAETGTMRESVKDIEAYKDYCIGLTAHLESQFKSRDKRDLHFITALEQINEYIQGVLAQVSLLPKDEVHSTAPRTVTQMPQQGPAGTEVHENGSGDFAMQKTLLQIVEKDTEVNLDHIQHELGSSSKKLLSVAEDNPQVERYELENGRLKERILKLELELAAALVDKNLADDFDERLLKSAGSKFLEKDTKLPLQHQKYGVAALAQEESCKELLALPELHRGQPDRQPKEISGSSSESWRLSTSSGLSSGSKPSGRSSDRSAAVSLLPPSVHSFHYLDEAPERAFVINVRRLIATQKILALLHTLLNSTAIAALTLAQAGTRFQLCSTACFLSSILVIYAMHDNRWDHIDINDMCSLLSLLSDDCQEEAEVHNPNRLLKAMTFTVSCFWRWIWFALHCIGVVFCIATWILLERYWFYTEQDEVDREGKGTGVDAWNKWWEIPMDISKNEDDGAVLGMQIMVGTLMFVLHLLFEFTYQREMCGVMPQTSSGQVWDPRNDGLPFRYQLFGLPSMRFSSDTALRDLYRWIESAHPTKCISEIYPPEMALYALLGDEHRHFLKQALKEAKLFDGKVRKFIIDSTGSADPQSLGIELCFFDQQMKNYNCSYPGEFLEFGDAGMRARQSQVYDMVRTLRQMSKDKLLKSSSTQQSLQVPSNLVPIALGRGSSASVIY